MKISFWCSACDKEIDWGIVDSDSSLLLSSVRKAYTHLRKGHEVLLRDRVNIPQVKEYT